jgi:hypothetical protein
LLIVNRGTAVPIVNHPCRTAMLSALQIVNGETAVSGVETAVLEECGGGTAVQSLVVNRQSRIVNGWNGRC